MHPRSLIKTNGSGTSILAPMEKMMSIITTTTIRNLRRLLLINKKSRRMLKRLTLSSLRRNILEIRRSRVSCKSRVYSRQLSLRSRRATTLISHSHLCNKSYQRPSRSWLSPRTTLKLPRSQRSSCISCHTLTLMRDGSQLLMTLSPVMTITPPSLEEFVTSSILLLSSSPRRVRTTEHSLSPKPRCSKSGMIPNLTSPRTRLRLL